MSGERMERRVNTPRFSCSDDAAERSRLERWNVPGRSRVIHPVYGMVVVPHRSNFAAMLNAAEVWGCHWMDIRDAKVRVTEPGDVPVKMPAIRKRRTRQC